MTKLVPDFTKENQYEFECGVCHQRALGHKGRCVCDDCKQAAKSKEELDGPVPLFRDKSF